MLTKIKIYLGLFVFIAGISFSSSVFAEQALPAGGGDFTQAVVIGAGKYQGTLAPEADLYYQIEIQTGQEISVKGGFGVVGGENMYGWGYAYLYDGNEQELFSEYGGGGTMGPWLSKSKQNLYVRMENEETDETLTYNLEITLQDRFDAASQTDAGDTFEEALPIALGSYTGYLAGVSVMQTPYGDDFKDYYNVSLQKGINYEFKLAPPVEDEGQLALYDVNRELIDEKSSPNAGAIASLSLTPQANTSVFLVVGCGYKGGIFNYKLDVKSSDVLTKFYNCKEESCGVAGDYSSLEECQKATTKTCYQAESCDEKCGIGTEPPPQSASSFYSCSREKCESVGEYSSLDGCQKATTKTCYQTENCDQGCGAFSWPGITPDTMKIGFFSTIWKGFFGWYLVLYSVLWIALYVYLALCLQFLAKKTNTPNPWFAWIPIANIFLMLKIAQKPLWWFILILISPVNIVIGIIIWMKIAERRGKPSWVGILLIVPVVGIAIPGYLAFSKSGGEKTESAAPDVPTGIQEANKPVVGYKHLCKYCDKLIPPNSTVCPLCEKSNPLGPYRCPKCHEPIEKDWKVCSHCNQNLRIVCPFCEKVTFFGDHCEDCGARLLVACPHCNQEQPPISDNCIKCGESMEKKEK